MKKLISTTFNDLLNEMKPGLLVENSITVSGDTLLIKDQKYSLKNLGGIFIISTGKASIEMAEAAAKMLQEHFTNGLIVTPYESDIFHNKLSVVKASHPVPDKKSINAGNNLVDFLNNIPKNSLIINCLSGGTSSLLTLPPDDITIEDLNKTYDLLNQSGATIREINIVRKHLSKIKGGNLLRFIDPSVTLIDLIISDVPGDNPEIIGSGITTSDPSTFRDAYNILIKYKLWEKIPYTTKHYIRNGIDGLSPETVKPGSDPLINHFQYIIGSAGKLAERASELFLDEGYNVWVADNSYNEDVQQIANKIAAVIQGNNDVFIPAALIFYGESTVDVQGKGGRNQELALRGALEISGQNRITWLSAGTDGIDGPTDAAGAIVTGETIEKAKNLGINPQDFLKNNDAYHFHQKVGTLLKTGPTGNNMMDIQFILIE